jgi:hypothetical protein
MNGETPNKANPRPKEGAISDRINEGETDGKKKYTERICVGLKLWNRVGEVLNSNIGR